MKKNLSTYFVLFLSLLTIFSCSRSEDDGYTLSPYAFIKSFSIADIRSSYPSFTSDGRDTTVVKTVSMGSFAFTINQLTGEIYNNDSLPFATDVTKVVISLSAEGVPSIYDDSTSLYEAISKSDSIDFTAPRKFRVYSNDAQYHKDYTISINVHQVDPEMMVWAQMPAVDAVVPVRAMELDGNMYLFGKDSEGAAVVSVTAIDDANVWSTAGVTGLSVDALSTITVWGGQFYAVASGNLYSSADAKFWEVAASGLGAIAIVGASDEAGEIWIAGEQGLLRSKDGGSFEVTEALPNGFPLYGVSLMSYPLSHNKEIVRYMLVGYTTAAKDGDVAVWSRLSSEDKWVRYDNEGNTFTCPALKDVTAVRYNGNLYALGGAGNVNGVNVDAFSSFYVSKDNGIVWKENTSFYQRLPKELAGNNAPFAIAVDSKNYLWIINAGENGGVWKGIINRLGFKK